MRRPGTSAPVLSVVALTAAVTLTAGCGGAETGSAKAGTEQGVPAGTGYTSDRLQQALLTEIPGYQRSGEPESGEYGTLQAVRNTEQLRRQAQLDKPKCAGGTGASFGAAWQNVPAALATFSKDGQTVTQVLMAVSAESADKQVKTRIPQRCRTFRTKIDGEWSTHQVVEAVPGGLGRGSRTVGVATDAGGAHSRTWYAVVSGRGYLATITLHGGNVTRHDAEQLAREARQQADRILP